MTMNAQEKYKSQARQSRIIARHERAAQTLGERVKGWVRWERNMMLLKSIHAEIADKKTAMQNAIA